MPDLFSVFKPFAELVVLFSTKADGDMGLRSGAAENIACRERFFAANGIAPQSVVGFVAAHAADVARVGEREAGAVMKRVDGLITAEPGVFLSATAADCLALYLYDPVAREAALLHAGWRGLARGIVGKAISQFRQPARVRAGIGPFIQACHFKVGKDVAAVFSFHPEAIVRRDEGVFADLGAVALRQLLEAGVNSEYIEISEECTACRPDSYFSYRRDGEPLRTMVAVMGIQK